MYYNIGLDILCITVLLRVYPLDQGVLDWISKMFQLSTASVYDKLEALRERRPPWPRQIITLILPTVKMLSLGCQRLPPSPPPKKNQKKKNGSGSPRSGYATTIMVFFLFIYSSFNTQITTKI